jgi:hypothetical protein
VLVRWCFLFRRHGDPVLCAIASTQSYVTRFRAAIPVQSDFVKIISARRIHLQVRACKRAVALLVSTMLVATLAACGGDNPREVEAPDASPSATLPSPTPTVPPPAAIGEIVWAKGTDPNTNAPVDPVDFYLVSDRAIYAVARVTDLRPDSVISAAWSYNGASLDSETTGLIPGSVYRVGYVQFHLERGGSIEWPDGTYAVTISLDGQAVQSAQIEVRAE